MAPAIEFMPQHPDGRFACQLSWQPADPPFDPPEAFDLEEFDLAETMRSLLQSRNGEARGPHGLLRRGDPPRESKHTPVAIRGRFVGCGWSGFAAGVFIIAPTEEVAFRCSWTGGLRVQGDEA